MIYYQFKPLHPPCNHFSYPNLLSTFCKPAQPEKNVINFCKPPIPLPTYPPIPHTPSDHPSTHHKARDFIKTLFLPPQPTFNPSVARISAQTQAFCPVTSKSLCQKLKAFKYYYVLMTIFKKENYLVTIPVSTSIFSWSL